MTKRALLILLAATMLLSGCLFSRKHRKQKETGAIASDVEHEFKQRWVAKRVADLAAQGVTGAAAEEQANREYEQKFSFAAPSLTKK